MYVLIALLLLGILITVHEAGHFMAARLTGIDVSEFAIGMGPKLLSWKSKKYDTQFSLRLIPVGGYCAFYGEDDAPGKHTADTRAYNNQPVWKRIITVACGPLMNFVLAFIVALLFYWIGGISTPTGIEPFIHQVNAAGPAYEAGLQDGDVIESINGVSMLDGTMETLTGTIGAYREGDAPLQMVIRRGDTTFEAELTPYWSEEEGRALIGVTLSGYYQYETQPCSFLQAAAESWSTCLYAGGMIITALKDLVTTGEGLDQTAGPVGVVSMVSQQVAVGGFETFLNYLVVISINLGIMNLLPIPGLDGSRLIFMTIEAIRRKPIAPQKEATVHLIGMLFLFAVMIFFTFKDILRLFQ
ncbi:MAG: site-2 protease family protein [Clostridia bacterium]|nr:site-2 protease family protein [Clostridia bacterium]